MTKQAIQVQNIRAAPRVVDIRQAGLQAYCESSRATTAQQKANIGLRDKSFVLPRFSKRVSLVYAKNKAKPTTIQPPMHLMTRPRVPKFNQSKPRVTNLVPQMENTLNKENAARNICPANPVQSSQIAVQTH